MKLPGPFYPINVKVVSEKYLNRKFRLSRRTDETLKGFFDGETIWITKDDIHTLLHEWFHAFLHQSDQHNLDEEGKCNSFANLASEMFHVEHIDQVLK